MIPRFINSFFVCSMVICSFLSYMWMCVCVGFVVSFVMCGCFDSCVGVFIICVLVFTVFCIVSFMYIYSYLLLV